MDLKTYPIPRNLKNVRETQMHMTVKEAAALVGVTARAWQQWESGARRIPETAWRLVTTYYQLRIAQDRIKQLESQLKSQPAGRPDLA